MPRASPSNLEHPRTSPSIHELAWATRAAPGSGRQQAIVYEQPQTNDQWVQDGWFPTVAGVRSSVGTYGRNDIVTRLTYSIKH